MAILGLVSLVLVASFAASARASNESCPACEQLARASAPKILNFQLPVFPDDHVAMWDGRGALPGSAPDVPGNSLPELNAQWKHPFWTEQLPAGMPFNPFAFGQYSYVFGVPVFTLGAASPFFIPILN
ncbi:MAG: hypothetical protein ACXWP5_12385 [Bdellovibrionota bacterium]